MKETDEVSTHEHNGALQHRHPSLSRAINNSYEYFDTGDFEKDLAKLVKIPSQSQIPSEVSSCEKYLKKAMIPKFHEMGFQTKIYENPIKNIGPVLLATRIEDPNLTKKIIL